MSNNNFDEKILGSVPGTYFYGEIVELNNQIDLKILKTNHANQECNDKLFTELDLPLSSKINWKCCLLYTQENGNLNTSLFSLNKLSDTEMIIWIYPESTSSLHTIQEELDTQKSLLQLFIDSIPDIIFYKDVEGRYITCNQALADLINGNKSDIIGKKDSEIPILNKQSHKCEKFDQQVISSNQAITVEEKVYLPEDKVLTMESLKVPFFDKDNVGLGVIGICRDITEKSKIEEALEKSELRFRQTLENISDVITVIEDGKVTYVNQAFEKVYGESCEYLYTYGSLDYFITTLSPDDAQTLGDIDFDKLIDIQGCLARKDGVEKWVHLKCQPFKNELTSSTTHIVVVSDVTSYIKEELKLQELRNEFFTSVSHELKTPIHLIHSALQMMSINLNELPIETSIYDKYINICNQNIFRLLKLITNIIDSTKINTGHFEYKPQNYNIVNIIESIISSTVPYCEQNNISILFDTNVEEYIAYIDLEMIERIVLNLLSNAVKYSKGTRIDVDLHVSDTCIQLSVSDNGIGISQDAHSTLFNLFAQGSNISHAQGSGIGLHLVKSFTEMHGGQVYITSESGQGTCFIVKLPNTTYQSNAHSTIFYQTPDCVARTKLELCDL